jgi:hypothetical protein
MFGSFLDEWVFFFVCFAAGEWIQCLVHTRQVLPLSYIPILDECCNTTGWLGLGIVHLKRGGRGRGKEEESREMAALQYSRSYQGTQMLESLGLFICGSWGWIFTHSLLLSTYWTSAPYNFFFRDCRLKIIANTVRWFLYKEILFFQWYDRKTCVMADTNL